MIKLWIALIFFSGMTLATGEAAWGAVVLGTVAVMEWRRSQGE